MPITERTLRKMRKNALGWKQFRNKNPFIGNEDTKRLDTYSDWIIKLTQELLDQHLLRKE